MITSCKYKHSVKLFLINYYLNIRSKFRNSLNFVNYSSFRCLVEKSNRIFPCIRTLYRIFKIEIRFILKNIFYKS